MPTPTPISGLTVDQVALPPDHGLIVARGVLDRTTTAQLHAAIAHLLDAGVRHVIADVAQISRCDPTALAVLALAARQLTGRRGWLRMVAASDVVISALEITDICDVLDLYRAHHGTPDAS